MSPWEQLHSGGAQLYIMIAMLQAVPYLIKGYQFDGIRLEAHDVL